MASRSLRIVWLPVLVGGCLLLGWWLSQPHERHPPPAAPAGAYPADAVAARGCPLPPHAASTAVPLQTPAPAGMQPFVRGNASLQPLAGFSVEARVLGSERYRHDREAALAPLDLALGWGRMAEDAVLSRLQISQGGRWYRYRWQGEPPIPRDEIVASSANMHMIPADDAVATALERIGRDDRVRIDGWLVEARTSDGWRWRSSLTRDDQGQGACELVYVCAVSRE